MDGAGEDSFDPRRWGRTTPPAIAPAASAATIAAAPSFDPRSWTAPPVTPPRPAAPLAARPTPATSSRTGLAIGAGVAIAAAGALIAWSARPPVRIATTAMAVAAAVPPIASRRTLTVAGPAAITSSLSAAGIAPTDASDAGVRAAAALGPAAGDVRLVFDLSGPPGAARLGFLEATHDDGSGLALTRNGTGWALERYAAHLTTRLDTVRGRLDAQSFYPAAVAAGLRDTLVGDFAGAFAFDFDFQREVGPGTRIDASYDQRVNAAGEPVGVPVLVYAALATSSRARALYRFSAPGDRSPGWYDAGGHSTVRALMRTPIDAVRISSPFGMRDHPILGFMKMHTGVDFAAPVGTPIYAAGDGLVEFAALKGPNGNFVKLRHDNGWETLYLHMNRIWPGLAPGVRVRQGQQIGEVGLTGRTTGPHLHYEVHIAGAPVNPLGIDTGTGKALAGATLAAFKRERDRIEMARAGGAIPAPRP